MKSRYLALVMLVSLPLPASAGIHLGMKLACQRYAEAWKSGNLVLLKSAMTPEFAAVWDRMSRQKFAELPRKNGPTFIVSTEKHNSDGRVNVQTPDGMVTFLLVGSGFDWKVADILRPGDDGKAISGKNYLEITLTAGEFIANLREIGSTSFYASVTRRFRTAFQELPANDLQRIRTFLPDVSHVARPKVCIDRNRATMQVRVSHQTPDDVVIFRLQHEGTWKVDDYVIDSRSITIPSFRNSLYALARLSAFGEFSKNPAKIDPCDFTTDGPLRQELLVVKAQNEFPLPNPGKRRELIVSPEGKIVTVGFPDHCVQFTFGDEDGRKRLIRSIEVARGESKTELCRILETKRNLNTLSKATGIVFKLLERLPAKKSLPSKPNDSQTETVGATLAFPVGANRLKANARECD